jgi:Spy/CpxP family protein refolding chaperone
MSKRTIVFGIALAVSGLLAGNTSGQPFGWGYQTAWGPNYLGLTEEQMNQIQEINTKWQNELLPLWTQLQEKMTELQNLMFSTSPDPTVVEEKTKEMGALQAQIQRKSIEKRNAIRGVLNDEQKILYDQTGMGSGWGRGPCGLGLGVMWGRGYGRGRGRGFGRAGGFGWTQNPQMPGLGYGIGAGFVGSGWGRGPCGMGLGRTGWGRRRW